MKKIAFKKALRVVASMLVAFIVTVNLINVSVKAETGDSPVEKTLGSISIQLLDRNGTPYVGLSAWLVDKGGKSIVAWAVSNEDGFINISNLPIGDYKLRVNAQDAYLGFFSTDWIYVDNVTSDVSEGEKSDELNSDDNTPVINDEI